MGNKRKPSFLSTIADRRAVYARIVQMMGVIPIGRLAKRLGTTVETLDSMRHGGKSERIWVHIAARLEELEVEVQRYKLPPGYTARQLSLYDLWPPGVPHNGRGLIV